MRRDTDMSDMARNRRYSVSSSAADVGTRLDRLLAAALAELSRSRIKALIEAGRVTAGGATLSDPSYRVKSGQTFAIFVPEAAAAKPEAQAIPLVVAYEDAELIVIDKPAGLVVHPAPGNPDRTLVNALLAHCGDSLSGIGGVRRPGIVHRIDKDTSGLMVVAKTDRAHAALAEQFAAHSIRRAYDAVVRGVPRPRRGRIEGPIGRNPRNRKKMAVVRRGGKPAVTHYRVLKAYGESASLVECRLETGRTHQIRVHMASLGHPIVGDPLYGRGSRTRRGGRQRKDSGADAPLPALPRQALHAKQLGFEHPVSGEQHDYISQFPFDINGLLEKLESLEK